MLCAGCGMPVTWISCVVPMIGRLTGVQPRPVASTETDAGRLVLRSVFGGACVLPRVKPTMQSSGWLGTKR